MTEDQFDTKNTVSKRLVDVVTFSSHLGFINISLDVMANIFLLDWVDAQNNIMFYMKEWLNPSREKN